MYKNINIWIGTTGFSTPRNIKEASVVFRVENAWMNANGATSNDIKLLRWNGSKWIQLETEEMMKDDLNTIFEAKTKLQEIYLQQSLHLDLKPS